jgi:hypothetical protein
MAALWKELATKPARLQGSGVCRNLLPCTTTIPFRLMAMLKAGFATTPRSVLRPMAGMLLDRSTAMTSPRCRPLSNRRATGQPKAARAGLRLLLLFVKPLLVRVRLTEQARQRPMARPLVLKKLRSREKPLAGPMHPSNCPMKLLRPGTRASLARRTRRLGLQHGPLRQSGGVQTPYVGWLAQRLRCHHAGLHREAL